MKRRGRALRRRYGHATVPRGYTSHTAPANSLQENVYRAGLLVGTANLKGPRHWVWWLAYIPEGEHAHPSGTVSTLDEAYAAIKRADRKGRRR
jgi:hypothetical protein